MDWYEIVAGILALVLTYWVGLRRTIKRVLRSAKELGDVIAAAVKANADGNLTGDEIKEIEKQWKEFVASLK